MREKIVAVVGAYNEESRIGYTLESIKMFDEIIVFDKHSTDRTVEIASSYTDRIYTLPFNDDKMDPERIAVSEKALAECDCQWVMALTCSDVLHPRLYEEAVNYISTHDVDALEVPFYRYSMGFTSKYSFYGAYHHKNILYKREKYVRDPNIHAMVKLTKGSKVGRLELADHDIAVYHLTHESLEMIMERHLRYAAVEADGVPSREEGLKMTWKELIRQVYIFFRLRTYKLGEIGKAQLCMLLVYRAAKYLHVFFDQEQEEAIIKSYDDIRNKLLSQDEKGEATDC